MSNRMKREPNGDDLRELPQVLMHIFEMVRRLPPGAERSNSTQQLSIVPRANTLQRWPLRPCLSLQ